MDDEQVEPTRITRRDALRRGALLGGALTWSVPVVQLVGMKPAMAQVPSPACVSTTCAFAGDQILRCEPANPDGHPCFCCCAEIDEFCSDCFQANPCVSTLNCVLLDAGTPCP